MNLVTAVLVCFVDDAIGEGERKNRNGERIGPKVVTEDLCTS